MSSRISSKHSDISNKDFEFRLIINAVENGVFSVEIKNSSSVAILTDNSLKFESLKPQQSSCFKYQLPESNRERLVVNIKSVKGDFKLYLNSALPANESNYIREYNIKDQINDKFIIDSELLLKSNVCYLCAVNTNQTVAYFSVQVFAANNIDLIKNHKKLLYSNYNIII